MSVDLLVGQSRKRGHAAFRTSGANIAGQLFPPGVGKDHQRAREIGSAGASARVVPMAEAALRFEHLLRPRDRRLIEHRSPAAPRDRRSAGATSAAGGPCADAGA